MEREILFRGKRKDNGEWVEGVPVSNPFITCIFKLMDGISELTGFEVYPETVEQYTGLTDRNGTKIFEGDIVDILCENEGIGVIEWDKDTAQFIVSADGFCADFDNYYGTDLEVIGNIHDNPELLGDNEND